MQTYQPTKLLTKGTAEVQQLLSVFGPAEQLRIEGRRCNAKLEKGKLADASIWKLNMVSSVVFQNVTERRTILNARSL